MRRVTLRSLWEHKRRLISTVVAILIGVSFMTGTFILSTTLDQAYDDLFSSALDDVDALVRGPFVFEDPFGVSHYDQLPASVVDEVAELDGVAAAEPRVAVGGQTAVNRVLDHEGKVVGGSSSPTTFENWIEHDTLNPYTIDDGRPPRTGDEIALNVGAVESAGFELGDVVSTIGTNGPKDYRLVGTFTFGTAKSAAGAVTAEVTLEEARRLANLEEGEIERVLVDAEDGVTEDELVEVLQAALGDVDVVSGTDAIQELSANRTAGFGFIQTMLNVFGVVALFVGIFVISNTFSILVAQRTRELALLRALGASRGQVLGSMLLEAAVVGGVAALLGLGGGLLLARGIGGALGAIGAKLPTDDLVLRPVTLLLSLAIGISVTVLAALIPAVRATRVPPLAALRDVALDRSGVSRGRIVAGAVLVVVGTWNVTAAWRYGGHSRALPAVGFGSLCLLAGALVIGPVLAGPTVRIFGRPLPRLAGITGRLATDNASRSPKRTSATASAVVIGVALVTFVAVFARSANQSVDEEVKRIFAGDLLVKAEGGGPGRAIGIPRQVAERVAEVPGVAEVTAGGAGLAEITYPNGRTASHFITSIDPAGFGSIVRPNLVEGTVDDFDDDGILVDRFIADDHDIEIGDTIVLRSPNFELEQVVQGIIDDRNVLGFLAITRATFAEANPDALDVQVGAVLEPEADLEEVMAAVEDELEPFPGVEVLDRDGVVGDLKTQITSLIAMMYGLLMLSVIIALIGVANTLSLSINERVRELGLLRAIGMDRAAVRSAVRWEAWLICLLGTLVGVTVGLLISVTMVKVLRSLGLTHFAAPIVGIAVIIGLSAVLGTVASIRPARRAAAVPVLQAIAAE